LPSRIVPTRWAERTSGCARAKGGGTLDPDVTHHGFRIMVRSSGSIEFDGRPLD
jgi:hypothetical protein